MPIVRTQARGNNRLACQETLISGVCYLTLSTAQLLSPRLALTLFPSILVPAFVGELSFAVWLTVKGVKMASLPEEAERSSASL